MITGADSTGGTMSGGMMSGGWMNEIQEQQARKPPPLLERRGRLFLNFCYGV